MALQGKGGLKSMMQAERLSLSLTRPSFLPRRCESGCVVKHWSPLLATSRAQQLLFRIVDGMLLPHSLPPHDRALRSSLPLYLQVGGPPPCN